VWSTMPTDQPSPSSQMLRVGLPSTFMAESHNAVRRARKVAHRGCRLVAFSDGKPEAHFS
ncbi:MAG TPA: hypothetical protein VIY51_22810, partial [Xanthobacteraceae bacterium]